MRSNYNPQAYADHTFMYATRLLEYIMPGLQIATNATWSYNVLTGQDRVVLKWQIFCNSHSTEEKALAFSTDNQGNTDITNRKVCKAVDLAVGKIIPQVLEIVAEQGSNVNHRQFIKFWAKSAPESSEIISKLMKCASFDSNPELISELSLAADPATRWIGHEFLKAQDPAQFTWLLSLLRKSVSHTK